MEGAVNDQGAAVMAQAPPRTAGPQPMTIHHVVEPLVRAIVNGNQDVTAAQENLREAKTLRWPGSIMRWGGCNRAMGIDKGTHCGASLQLT